MCLDHECPMKLKCYRYTAPVNEYRQSYFTDSPRKGDECTDFWDNKGRWLDKQYKHLEENDD